MGLRGLPVCVIGLALIALATACGNQAATGPTQSFVPLFPWDGGADAGCSIGTTGERVGCATAYVVSGNPYACAGFDDGGAGSTETCKAACMSGLVCNLSGLSDGTNVVDCTANCASPEH